MISHNQELELIKLYKKGVTTKELCVRYGWKVSNRHGPLNVLKKHNIDIRKDNETHAIRYTIDENYFNKIDTKAKAYFLGLLFADGSVDKDKNTVSIGLVLEDVALLNLFKFHINSNKPLRQKKNKLKNTHKDFTVLSIENKTIKEDLISHGCLPGKSFITPTLPKLEKNLISHFIRGYFDGDGCVTYSSHKKYPNGISPIIGLTGLKGFIDEIVYILNKDIGLNINKFQKRYKKSSIDSGSITWGGKNVCKLFYDYIYKDCDDLFLERKKTKLTALLKGDFKKDSI